MAARPPLRRIQQEGSRRRTDIPATAATTAPSLSGINFSSCVLVLLSPIHTSVLFVLFQLFKMCSCLFVSDGRKITAQTM
jgi:hypothetical protein